MVEACVVPSGVDGGGSGGGAPVAQAMAEARVVAVPVPATSEAAAEASPAAARFDDDRLTDGEGVVGGKAAMAIKRTIELSFPYSSHAHPHARSRRHPPPGPRQLPPPRRGMEG